jgi:uncharacterized protein with von Willebrand factor type A (vWA) domain
MQPLFSGFFRLFSSGSSISYAASRRTRRKSISFSNWIYRFLSAEGAKASPWGEAGKNL